MKSSSAIGRTAELRVATKLMDLGYQVFQPLSTDLGYDLLTGHVDSPHDFERVQVKVGWRQPNGRIKLSLRYNDNDYEAGTFDWLAIVNGERIWFLPWDLVFPQYTITVGNGGEWDKYEITTLSASTLVTA